MGVQYCQITEPCLCGKWQIWVTKVKIEKKNYHPNNISGGAKDPPPPPSPTPARSLNTMFRNENEDWNLLGNQTLSANRSGTMFDVCEPVVLVLCRWCSFPENREWSSRGVVILLLFATKSVHVACFTDTKQTWFALSDEPPVHARTPAKFYPIGIQYLRK